MRGFFYEISTPLMRTMLPMVNVDQIMISEHCAHCVYEIFSVFKLFEITLCFVHFGLFEISTPVMRTMHHISNHHFQHCAHSVDEIYSVFKLFEIAVCFVHFGLFEIFTPVMRTMVSMANIV